MRPRPLDHNDFCIRTLYRPSDVLGGDMIRLAHAEQVIRRLSNLAAQVSGVERDDRRALLVSYAASRSSSEPSPRLQSHV